MEQAPFRSVAWPHTRAASLQAIVSQMYVHLSWLCLSTFTPVASCFQSISCWQWMILVVNKSCLLIFLKPSRFISLVCCEDKWHHRWGHLCLFWSYLIFHEIMALSEWKLNSFQNAFLFSIGEWRFLLSWWKTTQIQLVLHLISWMLLSRGFWGALWWCPLGATRSWLLLHRK